MKPRAELRRPRGVFAASALEQALSETGFDALIVDAGIALPVLGRRHGRAAPRGAALRSLGAAGGPVPPAAACVRSTRPLLVRVAPEDYWYEQAPLGTPFWARALRRARGRRREEAWELVAHQGRSTAYVGDAPGRGGQEARASPRASINPAALVARLDWDRSYKTPYEIACIEEAQRAGRPRPRQPRPAAFEAGASELEIHHAYVAAVGCVDKELPYESIVGLDEKGAILHYNRQAHAARRQGAPDRRRRHAPRLRLRHHPHLDHRRLRRDLPRPARWHGRARAGTV